METKRDTQRTWRRPGALAALALLLLLLAGDVQAKSKTKKVSDYFMVCRRTDPTFNDCVKRSIEEAMPRLAKGMPEVHLTPIDPLAFEVLELREGQGNFLFLLRLHNLTIMGFKDSTVRAVKSDLLRGEWHLDIWTQHLMIEGDYEMEGRILALPIQGNGRCTMEFDGVSTIVDIQLKNITRNGKIYNQVENIKWSINVENAKSNFTNLFNGDKTLGETTNKFLKENSKDAFETYKHLPEEAFAQFLTDLENRFFEQFPMDELYPE